MQIPKIDPEILRQSEKMVKSKKKADRRQYFKDHIFDILNLLIASAALIVAVIALFFP